MCTEKRRVTSDIPLFALLKCKYTVIIQYSIMLDTKVHKVGWENIQIYLFLFRLHIFIIIMQPAQQIGFSRVTLQKNWRT